MIETSQMKTATAPKELTITKRLRENKPCFKAALCMIN